jgi:16S rRNA (guanine527-N7)-methyltransferase
MAEDERIDGAECLTASGAARARAGLHVDDRGAAPRRVAPDAPLRLSSVGRSDTVTAPDPAVLRAPLPEDPASLPPLGPSFDRAIGDGLRELGLDGTRGGSDAAIGSYDAHARLLAVWNRAINLTAIRDPEAVARRHVCDSLTAVATLDAVAVPRRSLLDLGSGGGYPGLPLAAALPWRRVALVESVAKKARFLGVASRAVSDALVEGGLDAPAIDVLAERAEDLAQDAEQRAAWDVVTVRAVGSLAQSAELALPLLRVGGRLVAWRRDASGDSLRGELREAGPIVRACGGGRARIVVVSLPDLADHRLVVVRKDRPTPGIYPRDATRRGRRR